MTEHEEQQRDAELGDRLKHAVDASAGSPGAIDTAILETARAAGATIRSRSTRRWPALAASFVLGAALTGASIHWLTGSASVESPLLVPVSLSLRDGTSQPQSVAAESVAPQVWYDHIEQLVYSGRLEEAERHLRRFNELHPGFRPEP
jgi:hypothetical protein